MCNDSPQSIDPFEDVQRADGCSRFRPDNVFVHRYPGHIANNFDVLVGENELDVLRTLKQRDPACGNCAPPTQHCPPGMGAGNSVRVVP